MLPGLNGVEICRSARRAGVESPILMLTALNSRSDKVKGLDNGADDYMIKPFHIDELLARVRALMRRNHSARQAELVVANLTLDPATRLAKRGDTQIILTAKEYALLEYLMRKSGTVVSESELIDHVWDSEYDGLSNIVRTYVKYVRKKIAPNGEPELIRTRRGHGYVISAEGHVV
jgi:DNA-binding response OmpR family regulator